MFEQTEPSTAATPVSRLFILLALTGARRGEILKLKWKDVDLDRGKITLHSDKTGNERWVRLAGASEGEVAPRLAELLRIWKVEEDREYVLPHTGIQKPAYAKYGWQKVLEVLNVEGRDAIGPQRLRSNFTSYASSLGIPASIAAQWQGHSSDVAENHYREQVLDRDANARDFEEAMGLSDILDEMIGEVHNTGPQRASAVGPREQTRIESSLAKLPSSLAYFKNAVSCFTETDSTFRPGDEMFTVAQHIAHVAITLDWYMEPLISGEGFDTDLDGLAQRARGVVSLNTAMHMVEKAYSAAMRFISDQDEAYLMTPLPDGPIMGATPRIAVVDGIVSHTTYHCGSLAVYARLANKIPAMPYGEM